MLAAPENKRTHNPVGRHLSLTIYNREEPNLGGRTNSAHLDVPIFTDSYKYCYTCNYSKCNLNTTQDLKVKGSFGTQHRRNAGLGETQGYDRIVGGKKRIRKHRIGIEMIVCNIGKEEHMLVTVIQFLSHLVTSIIPFFLFLLPTIACLWYE